ncbi:VWA domain-containing protein [bacterium]|nr:MAG: VWA domain-containing protein [bacterium]
MPSVPFRYEWVLYTSPSFGVPTSDTVLRCWTRRRALNSIAVFGGQTRFVAADAALWVDSRGIRPHLDKTFEGAIAPPSPLQIPIVNDVPRDLKTVEGVMVLGANERALVAPGVPLHVRWEAPRLNFADSSNDSESQIPSSGGGWAWSCFNALSGALVVGGVARVPLTSTLWEIALPSPQLGECWMLWVAAQGVEKAYVWPADYQSVTGSSESKPLKYLWRHPTRGPLHFDPKYRVGAMPYDRTDPVQAALLDATETFEASGGLILRTEWADKLLTFNPDGSVTTAGGEWSCLKIQCAENWCGDSNVSLAACAGASLWLDVGETGVLTPRVIEPRLRSINDFFEDENGDFWVTGGISTRSGRACALLRLDSAWNVVKTYIYNPLEDLAAPSRAQSRVLLGAVDGRSITKSRGRLRVSTLAGQLELRGDALVRVGVGGRSSCVLTRMDGTQLEARVVDPDLATSPAYALFCAKTGGGHVVSDASPYAGPMLAKNLDSALCARETFFGIVVNTGKEDDKAPAQETLKEPLDNMQGLARWIVDGTETLGWWKQSRWDMSRVVAWSGGIYAFGLNADGMPRAHRWTGAGDGLLEMGLSLPYLVTWGQCGLTPDGESECIRVIGKKFFGRRALPGSYAAEGTFGARGAGGVGAGSGPPQVDFGWSSGLGAFAISRAACVAAGFDTDSFPPFLQWSEVGLCWLACASQPVDEDGTPLVPYLEFDNSGDPLLFKPGVGVVMPQDVTKWGSIRFTSGTCQGVVSRRLIPPANCGSMDVALVVDVTGSMGGSIANVREELSQIVRDLETASGGDYRLSLVTFTDRVKVVVSFAPSNADAITAALQTLVASGGNNEPEASDEALRTVVQELPASVSRPEQSGDFLPFRTDAVKVAIMVTDARPGSFDDSFTLGVNDENALDVANIAATKGVLISAVFVPRGYEEATITDIMMAYADVTGGLFTRTEPDGKGVAAAILDVVNSCGGTIVEEDIEYCTEDVVAPVSSCGSAQCVFEGHAGGAGESLRVGVFRIDTPGPQLAVWFDEKSNPTEFALMCKSEQRLWMRLDGETPITLAPDAELSQDDIEAMSEFNIPLRPWREEWLPRSARRVEVVVLLDEGIGLDVAFDAVH